MKFFTLATERGISLYLLDLNGGIDDVSGNGIARLFLTVVSAFADTTGRRTAATPSAGADRLRFSLQVGRVADRRLAVTVSSSQTRAARVGVLGFAAPPERGHQPQPAASPKPWRRLLLTVTVGGVYRERSSASEGETLSRMLVTSGHRETPGMVGSKARGCQEDERQDQHERATTAQYIAACVMLGICERRCPTTVDRSMARAVKARKTGAP